MSKYTTQLRWIVEQELDNKNLEHEEVNWKEIYKKIGLDDYPIFDEIYRETLNNKIIRRYYFREIGFETAAHFAWKLREFMHEIMPYYNQLYESQTLITDPLKDYHEDYKGMWDSENKTDRDIQEGEHNEGEGTRETENTTTNNDDFRNTFHDTPMSMLGSMEDEPSEIDMMQWATNVTYNHDAQNGTDNTNETTTNVRDKDAQRYEDVLAEGLGHSEHTTDGFRHSQSDLLLKYRETFLNIDLEIVDRCNALFFGLW